MINNVLEGIRRFQEHLIEVGLGRSVLALPAPRMTALPAPSSSLGSLTAVYEKMITEPEVRDVTRDLFASGYYNLAVQEAFKAVDHIVAVKADDLTQSGTPLMEATFSARNPKLIWSDRKTRSEQDEQLGYMKRGLSP
jgi:hypothetical protein